MGQEKKAACVRELTPLVKPCYILFLSDPFEDGNILNYNNLSSSALSITICCIYLICCWLVYPVCVHRCLSKLQTKAGDSLTSFLVFCSSICKNWTNDMMFSGIMHDVAVCQHSAPQLRELSWPLVMSSVSEQRTHAKITLSTQGCTTQDSGWLLEQHILLKML